MSTASLGRTQLYGSLSSTTVDALDVSLGATMAAPPLAVTVEGTTERSLRTTNASVLPRIEPGVDGARLVPSDGRRYDAVRTLGRGAMGEVSLVEDRDIGRSVALKRLLGEADRDPSAIARFVDEVRTIGKLEHPNIVPIHDVGVDENGRLFFVMKFVEGETLESVIERLRAGDVATRRDFDVTRCAEIFVSILRALEVAHAHGIVHRDIKPANVMIGRFGEVVLMDWGVARPIGGERGGNAVVAPPIDGRASVTSVGSLVGTPLYMSPEQACGRNDALDARSDLYSATVLFHELLNHGHHRFESARTLPDLLLRIQTTEPPSVTAVFDHAPDVPAEYAHFVRRGLRPDPAARWPSATQMIAELHLILDGRFRIQCPATFSKRVLRGAGRLVDRRPLTVLGLGLATTIIFAALALNAFFDVLGT